VYGRDPLPPALLSTAYVHSSADQPKTWRWLTGCNVAKSFTKPWLLTL
jgi:hypothetical protein